MPIMHLENSFLCCNLFLRMKKTLFAFCLISLITVSAGFSVEIQNNKRDTFVYADAVEAFKNALNEPYTPGTPFTDAQIYSNMGMALSSLRRYSEAFHALKKAQSLGLNNPSIEKELLWLRNNVGLF